MSRLLVKLDEHLSRSHAAFLREQGYSADSVHDEGLSGAADSALWQRVVTEGRFLVTLDLDFSDIRRFAPGPHSGILLIRSKNRGRQAVLDILRRVVAEQPLEQLRGCLAVADESFTRLRRVLPS